MKLSLLWSLTAVGCCAGLVLCVSCSSQSEPTAAPAAIEIDSSDHDADAEPDSTIAAEATPDAAEEPVMMEELTTELDPIQLEQGATTFESTASAAPGSAGLLANVGSGSSARSAQVGEAGQIPAVTGSAMSGRGMVGQARSVNSGMQMRSSGGGGFGGGEGFFGPSSIDELPAGQVAEDDNGRPQTEPSNREAYDEIVESPFKQVEEHPLSTFSIDVDTASYSNLRRFLTAGQLPPAGAVRIEELLNYFSYDYEQPKGDTPFAANVEIAAAPWNEKHRLVRIGVQGRKMETQQRPNCNLVFLIDTSGSMQSPNKLPLVVQSMLLLAEQLGEHDRVSIVTYAGSAGVLLPITAGNEHAKIEAAINSLNAGGSTNGAGGIRVAYELARQNFTKEGINRVILATDGDFNVGTTSESELVDLIEKEASSGVFLSVLGYGVGNYNDSMLEKLADKGNGNYAYIDTINESRKVLSEQMTGTLITIAKDVKIQIEFNPVTVAGYRLIGYENRLLQKEDFNDDKKDAGEIGAGHTVTALYEVVPFGVEMPESSVDPLKYQSVEKKFSDEAQRDELFTLKLRYKEPTRDTSKLVEMAVKDPDRKFAHASGDFQFAAAVASFGMTLRNSKFNRNLTLNAVLEIATSTKGQDPSGYRAEFVELVKRAKELQQ